MINRRHIGLALGMISAVLLTAGAIIASTAREPVDATNAVSVEAVLAAGNAKVRHTDSAP